MKENYDIIIVGGGHAGCEAAHASAKMGLLTLLVTPELNKLVAMPCNPAIGSPGKSHLVREIDALGGLMAKITDKTLIQIRLLNTSKGPAVQAYRAQVEKKDYMAKMFKTLQKTKNLDLLEDEVVGVKNEKGKMKKEINGVITKSGKIIKCKAAIITTGTFMNGQIIIGKKLKPGGRIDAKPTKGLSESLKKLGLKIGRLKTGTSPRLDKGSINFSKMTIQPGTKGPLSFSFPDRELIKAKNQIPCYLTYTTAKTHKLILKYKNLSPIYSGQITEAAPRHCPSLDRKIINFPHHNRHPLFLEPTGRKSPRMYLQGGSLSMPEKIQEKIIRSIPGLEKAKFLQYGYAVVYDFIPPNQIKNNLETKKNNGLFLAGQINGTSGYEEAAAQGLMAGINAALKIKKKNPFILRRSEAYIGVLIDDLVTKIHREPYRVYTSRAEYRLLLRQDNADLRLIKYGYKLGLVSKRYYQEVLAKQGKIQITINKFKKSYLKLSDKNKKNISYFNFLTQPNKKISQLRKIAKIPKLKPEIAKQIEIIASYEGYLNRQKREAEKAKSMENKKIPATIDYNKIPGLRNEVRQRLKEINPQTLGQASRLEGITPADLSILSIWLYRLSKI
jgi:tRNA uridine 5-carboxymethylaminomethyl modification enzyme